MHTTPRQLLLPRPSTAPAIGPVPGSPAAGPPDPPPLPRDGGPAHRAARPRRRLVHGARGLRLAVVVGAALVLPGCAVPGMPGASGAPDSLSRAASIEDQEPAGDPTRSADPSSADAGAGSSGGEGDAWVPVAGDLDGGAVTHRLSAAARTVVIDYWTDDDVSGLGPDSNAIVRINARIDGADDGAAITVTRFNARVASLGLELANDTGSFAMNPPYSYASAVPLPANPGARSTELLVTLDLLTETAPESGVFTRQTVLDTVSLAHARPPAGG